MSERVESRREEYEGRRDRDDNGGVLDDTRDTLRRSRELLDKIESKQLLDRADKLLKRVENFWLFKLMGL